MYNNNENGQNSVATSAQKIYILHNHYVNDYSDRNYYYCYTTEEAALNALNDWVNANLNNGWTEEDLETDNNGWACFNNGSRKDEYMVVESEIEA